MKLNKIHRGDCLELLKKTPDNFVDCVITSPPYWALRDYGTEPKIWDADSRCEHEWGALVPNATNLEFRAGHNTTVGNQKNSEVWSKKKPTSNFCQKCNAWHGSLGLEPTFELFIRHLCDIFDEAKRVLKPTGTCWVNIGDTYSQSGGAGSQYEKFSGKNRIDGFKKYNGHKVKGLPSKCLVGIPFRFALEMINRGWTLRNTIIWHKPNCMPSSANDRFTVDFEYVFFFVKNKKYYFEQQLEPFVPNTDMMYRKELRMGKQYTVKKPYKGNISYSKSKAQNPSDTKRRVLESMRKSGGKNKRAVWRITTKPFKDAHFATFPEDLIEPMIKAGCPKEGVVLDPFMGAGTTALVARKLGRDFLGFELSSEYIEIADKRIRPWVEQQKLSFDEKIGGLHEN